MVAGADAASFDPADLDDRRPPTGVVRGVGHEVEDLRRARSTLTDMDLVGTWQAAIAACRPSALLRGEGGAVAGEPEGRLLNRRALTGRCDLHLRGQSIY